MDPLPERLVVPAMIDKDLTSALLANQLGIGTLMILTAVAKVAVNFGRKNRRAIIAHPEAALPALQGRTATHVIAG